MRLFLSKVELFSLYLDSFEMDVTNMPEMTIMNASMLDKKVFVVHKCRLYAEEVFIQRKTSWNEENVQEKPCSVNTWCDTHDCYADLCQEEDDLKMEELENKECESECKTTIKWICNVDDTVYSIISANDGAVWNWLEEVPPNDVFLE